MKSILRIYISSTLNVAAQYTEVLTVTLDLTPNISKQPTVHDQVIHNNIHRIIQYDLRALILTPYLRCVEEEEDNMFWKRFTGAFVVTTWEQSPS